MLVRLGQRATADDLVGLLEQCHERIRKFLGLAVRLAASPPGADAGEIREVAGSVHRYFAVAFPLHLVDEEELIIPRLRQDAALAGALATIARQHAEHERDVTRLVELCAELERDPQWLATTAAELGATAARLSSELEAHLALEEQEVFPALRALPEPIREELRAEMRRRRAELPPQHR